MKKVLILMLVAVSALAFIGIESKASENHEFVIPIFYYEFYGTTPNSAGAQGMNESVTFARAYDVINELYNLEIPIYSRTALYTSSIVYPFLILSTITKTGDVLTITDNQSQSLSITSTGAIRSTYQKDYRWYIGTKINVIPVINTSQATINDIYENGLGGYYYIDEEYSINFQIITSNTYDYGAGYAEAMVQEDFSFWEVALSSVMLPFTILSVELMPGLPIGIFALIPIVFGLIAFFFSFKGGKK